MKNLSMVSVLVFLMSSASFAAPKTILQCRWWKSKQSFVRVNVLQLPDGRLRATFNDEPQSNMTAFSTFVQRSAGGAGSVIFQSIKPGSFIKNLRVEVSPGRPAVTISPLDGSRIEGVAGELSVLHIDVRKASGLDQLDTKVVCRY